jgi:hypothetical protein
MRMLLPRSFLPASLLAAACAGGPTTDASNATFAPMPMGETAAMAVPVATSVACRVPGEIEHTWVDAHGRQWQVAFRCSYATDDAHDALAAACVQQNQEAATACALPTLQKADLDTFAGIEACAEALQVQLDEVLFPCSAGNLQARVTGIEWTAWIVR